MCISINAMILKGISNIPYRIYELDLLVPPKQKLSEPTASGMQTEKIRCQLMFVLLLGTNNKYFSISLLLLQELLKEKQLPPYSKGVLEKHLTQITARANLLEDLVGQAISLNG